MNGLTLEVNTAHIERLFGLLPELMAQASRRAAARTRDWLATQLRRELGKVEKLPALATKNRFFRKGGQTHAMLWIGLNPVFADKAGPAVMTSKGVRAGRRVFEGAFLAHVKTGHTGIYVRKGKERLPILKVTIPVDESMEAILPKFEAGALRMFEDRLEHEISYLLQKEAA